MTSISKQARVAGFLYLLDVVIAPIRLAYIPNVLLTGDAAATMRNIATHETLFRFGMITDLFCAGLEIFLVLALYRLLEQVDRKQAAIMVILGVMTAPLFLMNVVNDTAVLMFASGADILSVFDRSQQEAFGMVFLHLHDQVNLAAEVFWGTWLFPLAILVFRSGFLPRFLGVWLFVNGIAWLVLCFVGFQLPQFSGSVSTFAFPAQLGEIAFTLWLLVMGARHGGIAPTPLQ